MIENDFSQRISILRYVLICAIVFFHAIPPEHLKYSDGNELISVFTTLVFRSPVPVLTCISAYLIFISKSDQKIITLFKKKTNSLLVPLIIWNFPLLVGTFLAHALGYDHEFRIQTYPFSVTNWLEGLLGLTGVPQNYPLNFLRDLFALSMLAPAFGVFLRRAPWVGLACVFLIFHFNFDGPLVLRNSMAINFYIGGMAASLSWNLRALDRSWPICVSSLAVLSVLTAYQYISTEWFRMLAPLVVWPLAGHLARTQVAPLLVRWSGNSFPIFVSHAPLLWALWELNAGLGQALPPEIFWIAGPVAAIAFGHALRWAAYGVAPELSRFAFGTR